MRLVHPYRTSLDRRGKVLGDFASHLRELIQKKHEPAPWAVVNCSVGAAPEEMAAKRTLANELFERVVYADDTFLLAVGLASQEVCKHSILIDIGATSIRGALMHGETPSPEERVEVPFGGEKGGRGAAEEPVHPLPRTPPDVEDPDRNQESLAFVAPERRACELRIQFRGKERAVDVTEILHDASSALVPPLLRAARDVLARCPSDEIEAFQRNIVLAGGGAELPGIVPRVEEELRADGFELARVRKVSGSRFLVARGALRWAHLLRDDQWSIPLFSFAG
jgi:actin-related protein